VSAESIEAGGRAGVDWRRAEFVLTLLAFLGFIALAIRFTTIYSGLPAHPLFVHVPVILIPTTIVISIVFMFRLDWFALRHRARGRLDHRDELGLPDDAGRRRPAQRAQSTAKPPT
jgi:hypothetical protein